MNMPTTASQTTVNADSRPQEGLRSIDPRDAQQKRDAFEDLLRSKLARFGQGETEEDESPGENAAPALAIGTPALHAVRAAAPQAAAAVETIKTGTHAAIEAALNSQPAEVATVGGTDPAAVWEASVREANSVPVDVRITRAEKTMHEPHAGLQVSVGSAAVSADVLSRHVPRLNERLRKRGVGLDHVRIQRDDEGDA